MNTEAQKQVCQLDEFGFFIGVTVADESPLEPGVFLMPFGTVDSEPPTIDSSERAYWDAGWVIEKIPAPIVTPEPDAVLSYDAARHKLYVSEADPLFFKWQRGDATQQDWLDKVAEIKAQYPKTV